MEAAHFQLIYDKDCPFCKWYSKLFVRLGFLTHRGRIDYQTAVQDLKLNIDAEKAKNKIALVDLQKGAVTYGIDSLLKLIGSKYAWMEKVGKFYPVYWFLTLLYSFISYNRKAIAPSECNGVCDCYPSKSYFWRISFILLVGLFVNQITWTYFSYHLKEYFISDFYFLDSVFYISQFAFQFVVFKALKQKNFYDYVGQIAAISLLGGLALFFFHLGFVVLSALGIDISLLEPFCYGMVYLFMLYEHIRRLKILNITWIMTLSFVLFRFLIYPFAFKM